MADKDKQQQTTPTEEDLKAGSPDSGMGELPSVLKKLNNLNLAKDIDKLEEDQREKADMDTAIVENGKVMLGRVPSVSSENSSPVESPWEMSPISQPQTRQERVTVITSLLETYFSDNYLTRDIFLLKHFKKSKEGWISTRFMASYKRIKRTAASMAEVEEACRASPMLDVNEDGTKVRRLAKLPECIEQYIPTRIAVAGGLPESMRNLTALAKTMGVFGPIASIQILRPGGVIPDALRETANALPEIRDQWCVMVEYEEMSSAGNMVAMFNGSSTVVKKKEEKVKEKKQEEDNEEEEGKKEEEGGEEKKKEEGDKEKDSEEEKPRLAWAVELIMPWRKRKNVDHKEAFWFDGKSFCPSCPSSGYSSPMQSPDDSPALVGGGRIVRGVTKRERLLMGRNKPQRVHQSYCHSPKSYRMQHYGSVHNSPCSDHSLTTRRYYSPQSSPRSTLSNWRTAAAN